MGVAVEFPPDFMYPVRARWGVRFGPSEAWRGTGGRGKIARELTNNCALSASSAILTCTRLRRGHAPTAATAEARSPLGRGRLEMHQKGVALRRAEGARSVRVVTRPRGGIFAVGRVLAVLVSLSVLAATAAHAQAVSAFVKSPKNPVRLAFDAKGKLFVADSPAGSIDEITANGSVLTFVSGLPAPQAVAFDADGNLYVGNGADGTIGKIAADGSVAVFAKGFARPQALAFDRKGHPFGADQIKGTVTGLGTHGRIIEVIADGFDMPSGLAFDAAGTLYVADAFNNKVSKVSAAGKVSVFAAGLAEPAGLAFDAKGNLYVAEMMGGIVARIAPYRSVATFASGLHGPLSLAFMPTAPFMSAAWTTRSARSPGMVSCRVWPRPQRPDLCRFRQGRAAFMCRTAATAVSPRQSRMASCRPSLWGPPHPTLWPLTKPAISTCQ